uniref:Uncharacterized protein n=1 Tax=Globisporangium ultimum (strain ATCC 200006 / CBS 805.95 / DAOM BR144) TaxID=431595 RepID=K3WNS8_GLOUD
MTADDAQFPLPTSTAGMRQRSSSSPLPSSKSPRKVASTRNVTCAPSQLHCRYANKKCSNPRAVKRTGGLHTFCALHRENANRNQRRLDQRKRLQKQEAMRSQAIAGMDDEPEPERVMPPYDGGEHLAALSLNNSNSSSDLLYEPLATPTPLRDEDVATLLTLFASSPHDDPCCFDDIPMPREPLPLLYHERLHHRDDTLR